MYVKAVIGILTLSFSIALNIQDSPQWRGQNRDGHVLASLSANWQAEPSLIWRIDVGEGHSSPVTEGNQIFVHSRQNDKEVVTCVNKSNGEIVWQQKYAAPYTMNSAAYAHGKGPKSTPVVHQGHLYTLGISGILSCFELASGSIRWQHHFRREFDHTSPLYGAAMSPIAVENLVIAHVGGENDGSLRAFDSRTGKVRWSWNGDGPGYASPILVDLEGVRQLVTQSQEHIVSVALSDGRLLWQIPFSTAWQQNVVSPVLHGDLLILSGLDKGMFAIRVRRGGTEWSTTQVWSTGEVSMYMSSPVLCEDLLFGLSHFKRGQLFCMDPNSGKVFWKGEGRQGDYAGLLTSGDLLFVQRTDGEFLVVEATHEAFRRLAQHTVANSPTWAHPVILGSKLLIKDSTSLSLWSF
jgi:outer membrane protein assembly factor BamB